MEAERKRSSVLNTILQAKASNAIPRIHGRLGDLGVIDEKYDEAISTAVHGLDYIVVETPAAASACVNMLCTNNLGVANFLILEKQAYHMSRLKEEVNTPEGVPRLFDLIEVQDERMKLAFFATMGNTLVAKDLDQAVRIAYGGNKEHWRVVTLDGIVIEQSGAMIGGGNRRCTGKMGTYIIGKGDEFHGKIENEVGEWLKNKKAKLDITQKQVYYHQ